MDLGHHPLVVFVSCRLEKLPVSPVAGVRNRHVGQHAGKNQNQQPHKRTSEQTDNTEHPGERRGDRTAPKGLMTRRYSSQHDLILSYQKSGEAFWNPDTMFVPYDAANLDEKTAIKYRQATALLKAGVHPKVVQERLGQLDLGHHGHLLIGPARDATRGDREACVDDGPGLIEPLFVGGRVHLVSSRPILASGEDPEKQRNPPLPGGLRRAGEI